MKYELIHTRSHLVVRIYSKYHHRETITIQSITKIFKISRVLPKLVSPLIFKNFLYYHYCITTQILDFLRYHHYLPKFKGQSITKNKTNALSHVHLKKLSQFQVYEKNTTVIENL